MTEAILFLVAFIAIWFVGARVLRGDDLSVFDVPRGPADSRVWWQRFASGASQTPEQRSVLESLGAMSRQQNGIPLLQRLGWLRTYMDTLFADHPFDGRILPTDAGGVSAEWVLAPGADCTRRTLYLHGGAYMMGSPRSHRVITQKFSEITGGAVLAIDYRLMPEHARRAGIEDCRTAYRWMLAHGPHGDGPAHAIFVAGDSAGGNLALSLLAWVRDAGLRAPDAAVALSPSTDSSHGSPSLRAHMASDAMLGPLFKPLTRLPRSALLWAGWAQNRMWPCNPLVSPVFGDLSRLPPLLIHASEVEMLLDDSLRYASRAVAAGSPVRLQTWNHMVHVWHIFYPGLTEAREAFEEIRKFLAAVSAALDSPRAAELAPVSLPS